MPSAASAGIRAAFTPHDPTKRAAPRCRPSSIGYRPGERQRVRCRRCRLFVSTARGHTWGHAPVRIVSGQAERGGFEPPNEVDPRYAISSRARSTAPAPLRGNLISVAWAGTRKAIAMFSGRGGDDPGPASARHPLPVTGERSPAQFSAKKRSPNRRPAASQLRAARRGRS